MLKVAILISGRGSNMKALVEGSRLHGSNYRVALVIANSVDAEGINLARELAVPVEIINNKGYTTREAFERQLDARFQHYDIELVCLAGFMLILTPWLLERWVDKIINIHPSLLPAFKGLNTHKKAIEAGVRFSGATVHFAHAEVDHGPIIVQAVVPVMPGDNAEALKARVLDVEHKIYPQAVKLIADGRVNVFEESVFVTGAGAPSSILISPLQE